MTTLKKRYEVRRADDRGRTQIGWLDSWHSFSFGQYRDRDHMGFGTLRVLNDDIIAPGAGFGTHPHDNMEILTWVLNGALAHQDSTGRSGVIEHGDLQVMSAGSGIEHSEKNASDTEPVHLIQIWIKTARRDIEPRYEDRSFEAGGRLDRWQIVASPDGRDGSLTINQDATMSVAHLQEGSHLELTTKEHRFGYLHVARGRVEVDTEVLNAGDAIKITGFASLALQAHSESELLYFDMR